MGEAEPVVQVDVRGGDRLAADRLLDTLQGERGHPRLDEEPGQELDGAPVVLVARTHALEQGDRLLALSRPGRGLAALEGEAGLAVELGGLPVVAGLLVHLGRGVELPSPLVGGGGFLLEPRPHVDRARGGPALPRLVGPRRLRQHSHRLEELGRPQEVASLDEPGRGLRGRVGLEGHFSPQVRGLHRVPRGLIGRGRALGVLRAHEHLGGLRGLAELAQGPAGLLEVAPLAVGLEGPAQVAGLFVEPAGQERALVVGALRGRGVGRGVGHVLHEVLLVGLRGLDELPLLLVGLRRAERIAALCVELGRLVPLVGQAVEPRRLEAVALLLEEDGRLSGLADLDQEGRRFLVVARLQVELGRPLAPAQLFVGGGGGPEFLALDVGLGGLGRPVRVFEHLARGQPVLLFLELPDGLLELGFAIAGAEHLAEYVVGGDLAPGEADLQPVAELLVDDQQDDRAEHPGNVGIVEEEVEKQVHFGGRHARAERGRAGVAPRSGGAQQPSRAGVCRGRIIADPDV